MITTATTHQQASLDWAFFPIKSYLKFFKQSCKEGFCYTHIKWENWTSEVQYKLSEISQLIRGRANIQTQTWFHGPHSFLCGNCSKQGFLKLRWLAFEARWLIVMRTVLGIMACWAAPLPSISSTSLVVTVKVVSRYCQMSHGGKIVPIWEMLS